MAVLSENRSRLAERAQLLRLESVKLADALRSGSFKSLYRGQGIEFSDVREYLYGDNVRAIDWNVTARMGRTFIKQYEEDRELQVFFIIDRSLSMLSGSRGKSRLEAASEAAAAMGGAAPLKMLGAAAGITAAVAKGGYKFGSWAYDKAKASIGGGGGGAGEAGEAGGSGGGAAPEPLPDSHRINEEQDDSE